MRRKPHAIKCLTAGCILLMLITWLYAVIHTGASFFQKTEFSYFPVYFSIHIVFLFFLGCSGCWCRWFYIHTSMYCATHTCMLYYIPNYHKRSTIFLCFFSLNMYVDVIQYNKDDWSSTRNRSGNCVQSGPTHAILYIVSIHCDFSQSKMDFSFFLKILTSFALPVITSFKFTIKEQGKR